MISGFREAKLWHRRRSACCAVAPLILALSISASSAPRAALSPGERAPDFVLKDRDGRTVRYDVSITTPTLFLSLKPNEMYTSPTLGILANIFSKYPQLTRGLNRWIVVSRYQGERDLAFLDGMPLKEWVVLLDPDDVFYKGYKIIATPTITLVGSDHIVAAVHPGYDPSMAQDTRLAIAKVTGAQLPRTVSATPTKPNMTLEMARRLASRGLWDRAIHYYEKAKDEGPLAPEVQLEIAEAYLKMREPEKALEILKGVSPKEVDASRYAKLRKEALDIEKSSAVPTQPPKIYR